MMEVLLRTEGYKTITANDGQQAMQLARDNSPDLILLDLGLPKMDGIQVARKLRRNRRFKTVPIVIVSGHNPAIFRQQALDAGCDEYLLKPVDLARLQQLLSQLRPAIRYVPDGRGKSAKQDEDGKLSKVRRSY